MGRAKKRRSVDTGPEGRENEPLRRPRPYLSRTQADVEREAALAGIATWLGMVERFGLRMAPAEVRLAFYDGCMAMWEMDDHERPRLPRRLVQQLDALLELKLAVEVEGGFVEFPAVIGGWLEIENRRAQYRASKAKNRRCPVDVHEKSTRSPREQAVPPEFTQVSRETSATEVPASNGTPPALRARKILDPKKVRSKKGLRKQELPVEGELFEVQETLELRKGKEKSARETIGEPSFCESQVVEKTRFRATDSSGFDAFWAIYPVHREKPVALKTWKEHGCEPIAERILAKVELLKREDSHWARGFVKHPHRWLRDEGWHDDPIRAPKPPLSRAEQYAAKVRRWVETGSDEPMDEDVVIDITPQRGMQ